MRSIALFVMLVFGIAAFSGGVIAEAATQKESTKKVYVGKKKVTVQSGDTLSKIAKANDTTYTRLFDANLKIKDPNVIFPGDKVRIPHPREELEHRGVKAPVPQKQEIKPVAYQAPAPGAAPNYQVSSTGGGAWDRLAGCESGGNWSINTGNGYYGGLQFSLSSWRAVGGSGYPHQASKSEQIARAEMLKARQGWSAWPSCSSQLALR